MFKGKSHDAMKPIIFPILKQLTPTAYETVFYDDRIEDLPDIMYGDIIAFSVETFTAKRAYELSKMYKREDNLIVMGGFHPSIMPNECKTHSDVVFIGDAEDTWPCFLKDYENREVKEFYRSKFLSKIPPINQKSAVFLGKKYHKISIMQFSRGCKFYCDFCSIKSMYKGAVRQKSIEDIKLELKNTDEDLLFFIDDNLFLNEESAISLFEAIAPLKKKWACQISIDIALNDKLLSLMKKSGCILVLIGFESLEEENLKKMKKVANLQMDNYDRAIKNIYRNGLLIYATFVLGYDFDTVDTIENTIKFASFYNFTVANFNILIPMPGTGVYERLNKENKLNFEKWWLHDGYKYGDAIFNPNSITADELQKYCRKARFDFYSFRSILKRFFLNPLHLRPKQAMIYFILNISSRLEIKRKQGKSLG